MVQFHFEPCDQDRISLIGRASLSELFVTILAQVLAVAQAVRMLATMPKNLFACT